MSWLAPPSPILLLTIVRASNAADLKLKDVAKALGKAFACGSSLSDTASGGKEIIIQGDVLDALATMLVDNYQVKAGVRIEQVPFGGGSQARSEARWMD